MQQDLGFCRRGYLGMKHAKEVNIKVKNPPLRLVLQCGTSNAFLNKQGDAEEHCVLSITMRDDEVYWIDMTGAQYGWSVRLSERNCMY